MSDQAFRPKIAHQLLGVTNMQSRFLMDIQFHDLKDLVTIPVK